VSTFRGWVLLVVLAATLGLAACEQDQPTAEERAAIEPLIRSFLLSMALAYSQEDPAPMAEVSSPRFMEEVKRQIRLVQAGGRRLEPVLVEVEILDLKVLRRTNAFVSVRETWDTRSFDVRTGEMIGQDAESVLHSHIHLKRIDRQWRVLFRDVEETATSPRLVLPSPTPG